MNDKSIGDPRGKNEYAWTQMILQETKEGIVNARALGPHRYSQDLWNTRLRQGGFNSKEFPPIVVPPIAVPPNLDPRPALGHVLQLLYVASPDECLSLRKRYGNAWELDNDHPAMRLHDATEYCQTQTQIDRAWDGIALSRLFRAKFGAMFHLHNGQSMIAFDNEEPQLWTAGRRDIFNHWQWFFDDVMGPKDQYLEGNARISAFQAFVKPSELPTYITATNIHQVDSKCALFPADDFVVRFRTDDDSLAATRVRWVGGVYGYHGKPFVVFDWGDKEHGMGITWDGNWAKCPPRRIDRKELESKFNKANIQICLVIFRRVEMDPENGVNHSTQG
ncbi:uncharacterized protein IWZ02DRAFT_431152 [Phyllosticta citriasiana]|uniref:uncharacterized protein n=1 Tax=Phyllosticta citriasiana TaxID=595635 RepID=UPI0030FDBD4F